MATKSRSRLIRRILYVLVGLVLVGFIVSRMFAPKPGPEYVTAKAAMGDVHQTVALTGTTEPKTRYQLQFAKNGKVAKILVEVGSHVHEGEVLASLQNDDANYQLESQKALLRVAQANLAKAMAGQRPEEVKLGQLKLDLAKLDQANAGTSQNNLLDIAQKNVNSAHIALQTAATNLAQAQDQYNYTLQTIQSSTWIQPSYQVYDSGYYYGDLRGNLPQNSGMGSSSTAAGSSSSGMSSASMAAQGYGSNAGSGDYLSNVNSLQTAKFNVEKAQQAYDQAQQAYDKTLADAKRQADDLDTAVKKAEVGVQSAQQQYQSVVAKPRDVDIAPLKAQVDQAWVGVHLAEYQLDQTLLKAPTDGIVTDIALDAGETAGLSPSFITLDSQYLFIKALVSEADIAKIQQGQKVTMTFDAFGASKEFEGTVYEVSPSETIVQGVVYYEVKISFDAKGEQVKPGMTANLNIETSTVSNVLKVPARAVQYEGNQAYVEVLKTVEKKQEIEKRNVDVGLQGDEDVEITSGLQADEEVVTFTKSS